MLRRMSFTEHHPPSPPSPLAEDRPTADQLLKHPFVSGCSDEIPVAAPSPASPADLLGALDAAAGAGGDGGASEQSERTQRNAGIDADLKDIVRKVQQARYYAARARYERRMRIISPE
jgi:hypothetical protein